MKRPILILLLSFGALFIQCTKDNQTEQAEQIDIPADQLSYINQTNQREGNAASGREYLLTGDYVDSGIPLTTYRNFFEEDQNNYLNRTGINQGISSEYNAFYAENGVPVVAPNCFQCHGSVLNGEYIIGLGNIDADFTVNQAGLYLLLDQYILNIYGASSLEYEAYAAFSRAIKATSGALQTETIGVNPADKLAAVLAGHRDPKTLAWSITDLLGVPDEVIPTDVPPWWLLKKKNSMFYTGVGRGDFARISMASSLLTIRDTIKAAEVDSHFEDVIAFIHSLEAPLYPYNIDQDLADLGESLFINNCSICHGKYGANESYPNVLVGLDLIQTDSSLIYANFGFDKFTDWYNNSWFGQGPFAAQLVPERGYIAPPLDGIWATAPYLHNGSVPDMVSLLDSGSRPTIWKRIPNAYNQQSMGWEYETLDNKIDVRTYDTQLPGYGNSGHYFGDHLIGQDRMAIIEYLKTL